MSLSEPGKRWTLFGGTWLLGILFMTAAFLKALDLNSFVHQIAQYQLVAPNLELPLGVALVALEGVLGLACLASFHSRKALWGMIALLTVFLAATLLRWRLLEGTNCNCFGPLVGGGPRSVVLHNTVLIAFAASIIALMRKTIVPSSLRGLRVGGGVLAMFLLMFVTHPFSASLPQDELAGDQIRIFLSATCEKCQKDAVKVKDLVNGTDVPPVLVFIGASNEQEIDEYFKKVDLRFKYTPMTFTQLSRETRHVPKVQVFRAGKIIKEWEGDVPSPDAVRQALAIAPNQAGSRLDLSTHTLTTKRSLLASGNERYLQSHRYLISP